MTRDNQFDWMRETIYEPKAQQFLSPGKPPSHFWTIAAWLCLAAVLLGAALAMVR